MASLVTGGFLGAAGASWAAGTTPKPDAASSATANYLRAVDSFNREDFEAASALLDKVPEDGNPHDRADVLNLRGAIFLRQHRYERARSFFAQARLLDPGLWAASFNEAEANFQQKNYADSRRQFAALLAVTPRASQPEEWALVQYKSLLASLLGGDAKPVKAYLAEHAKDTAPPPAYYFLNAAVEYRQAHQHEAGQWLAKSTYSPGAEQVYAQTFAQLGWPTPRAEHASTLVESHASAVPLAGPPVNSPAAFSAMDAETATAQKLPPATLAVVQLIPGHPNSLKTPARTAPPVVEMPAFRYGGPVAIPLPAEQPAVQDLPPAPNDNLKVDPGVEGGMLVGGGLPEPTVLARHRSHATPSPTTPASSPDATASDSPDASASPAASAGAGDASASPSASPAASPDAGASPAGSAAPAQPAFVQKYEAAYVKFIQKDYPGAKSLLDEADAIQPHQPSSISLRGQIFKHYYEAAYVNYLKADYPGALAQLDQAEMVQANQPDADNLRGLVFSRQHNYEQAENMFKKAIQADSTFWAAKFNLAELPFNYRNYTAARARFEDLFSQTDPVKQPREAELTQFKVFLTLLLEGKEAGARSFMEHFTYSGSTPARYFCQSALDFYHGDVDKAMGWLDSAKKEYPAQLVSIFIESFYRVGWMTDPAAHPELATGATTALPESSPSASPAAAMTPAPAVAAASPASTVAKATPAPSASLAPVVVKATPAPSASLAPVIVKATPAPSASLAPALAVASTSATPVAAAKPTPTVVPVKVAAVATPAPTAVLAAASPSATPVAAKPSATPFVVAALVTPPSAPAPTSAPVKATPTPTVIAAASPSVAPVAAKPSATPVKVAAVPVTSTASPAAVLAATPSFVAKPTPAASVVAATTPVARPTPAPTVVAAVKPTATPTATVIVPAVVTVATPTVAPTAAAEEVAEAATPASGEETEAESISPANNAVRILFVITVLGQMIFVWSKVALEFKRRQALLQKRRAAKASRPKTAEPDKVEAPR